MAGSMTGLCSGLALLRTPVILLMIPVILLVIPATLLVMIPVVKSGPIWSPWDRVWSYWESYSSLCLPAAPSEQGLCFFKKQEATTFHTGVVFVSSIEARFGTLWHALARFAVLLEGKHRK